ncbi:MAG: hypothetical protein HY878_06385 [Deltaproteobacteria bacterium]|nr:hypothetical protein [Deltaproteobacteria bacterium]
MIGCRGLLGGGCILAILILAGCMGGRTLTLDIHYDIARAPLSGFEGLKAAVVPLEDDRPQKEIGKWTGMTGKTDLFEPKGPVDETITKAIVEYLKKAGLDVATTEKGSLPAEFKTIPPHFIFSGRIEELRTEATSYLGYTQVRTRVRLKLDIKNVKDGSTLTMAIESLSEPKTVVAFSPRVFEDSLNDALSDGLDRILATLRLEGEVLKPKR